MKLHLPKLPPCDDSAFASSISVIKQSSLVHLMIESWILLTEVLEVLKKMLCQHQYSSDKNTELNLLKRQDQVMRMMPKVSKKDDLEAKLKYLHCLGRKRKLFSLRYIILCFLSEL